MKKYHFVFLLGILLSFTIISSCSKSSDDNVLTDENNDGNNNNGGDEFKESISLSIIKDGVEEDILIDEFIGHMVNTGEVEGYSIKKLELYTGYEETYPKIYAEFPLREGAFEFGTTYGENNDYKDFISIDFSEDIFYAENTNYSDLIDENWNQPWMKITSLTADGELTAEIGGTLIYHDYSNDTYKSLNIKSGTIQLKVDDDYPDVADNSMDIANPPVIGSGANIIADFDIRIPGTYISGTQMLFDTATLTIENKSSNADYFEWELVYPSTYHTDNYFYKETQVGTRFIYHNVKLQNSADSSYFYIQLTAYDNQGNSKTVTKGVSLPMIKGEFYLDGDLLLRDNIWYHAAGDRYRLNVGGLGTDHLDKAFNFGIKDMYPPMGTFLEDFHQMSNKYLPYPETDYEFYAEIGGENTFNDPNGEYSWLIIDNYSVQIVKGDIYKIFGKINASFVLKDPSGDQHTVEFRYLAPLDLY